MSTFALSQRAPSVPAVLALLLTWLAPAVVMIPFFLMFADILLNGLEQLSWSFIIERPRDAGRAGGIGPMIVSTLLIVATCISVAVPLSLGTALLLSEFTSRSPALANLVRLSLDALAAVPSILFGIFGNALFCITLGLGFSILSGGLTLACMVLPLLIRTSESSMRAIPGDYRLAAAALGLSKTRTIIRIVLPLSLPGLLVGLLLGICRALAETAALIYTSGYVDRMPGSLMDSGRALSIHILDLAMNVAGGDANAYASVIVLIVLLLLINTLAGLALKAFERRTGLSPSMAC